MSLYNETMDILKKYKISANKRLGQNFLINEDTIEGIIEAAEVVKEDLVIEIGPGLRKLNQKIAR